MCVCVCILGYDARARQSPVLNRAGPCMERRSYFVDITQIEGTCGRVCVRGFYANSSVWISVSDLM